MMLDTICVNNGIHSREHMKEIYRANSFEDTEDVVYWCKECGAIVVDVEYDNRKHHSKKPLEFPNVLNIILK